MERVRILTALIGAGLLCLIDAAAQAAPWTFLGARYQGMGGAGVAVVDDERAAYWNPGALAYGQSWGVPLVAGVQTAAEGDILRDVAEIASFIDEFDVDSALADIAAGNPLSNQDLQDTLKLTVELLPKFGSAGQGVVGNVSAGLTSRWGRFSLSGIGLSNFAADPILDLENLAFNTSGTTAGQITDAFGIVAPPSPPANQALANDIAGIFAAAGLTSVDAQNAADNLVFQAESAGIDTGDPRVQDSISDIASATAALDSGDITENETGTWVRGAGTIETGLGFGYAPPLPVIGDRIGIGANVKYIYGTTYTQFLGYDELDDLSDVLGNFTDRENVVHTQTWGLDLGMMINPLDWVRVGLTARNVNSPKLRMKGPGSIHLYPQVRAGAAVKVLPNWIVAADVDLTENRSDTLKGFESRIVSAGTEFGIPMGPVELALRGGFYTNVASEAANALALTGGLGLRVSGFVLDVAGGASPHTTELEFGGSGGRYPTRINLAATLGWSGTF